MDLEIPSILLKIKSWQTLYGAKRGNFKAYRTFCGRKSKKIRKSFKLSFGKKFSKEKFKAMTTNSQLIAEITKSKSDIANLLESYLLISEKNITQLTESKSSPLVDKSIAKKKIKRALHYIDIATSVLSDRLGDKNKLELSVYRSNILVSIYFESKKYVKAKEELLKIVNIVKQLIEVAPIVEKALLEELMDNAKNSLRYCRFQLKEFDNSETTAIIRDFEDLQTVMSSLAKNNINYQKIKVFGEEIEIDDPKTLELLTKEKILLENMKSTENLEELFWELVNTYEEGIKTCQKQKTESGNNPTLIKLWDKLNDFYTFKKSLVLFKRNIKMLNVYEQKFEIETNKIALSRKPQETVKQLDNILVIVRILNEMLNKNQKSNEGLNNVETILRVKKCLNICQIYYNNNLYNESLCLGQFQFQLISQKLNSKQDFEKSLDHVTLIDLEFGHDFDSLIALSANIYKEAYLIKLFLSNLIKQVKVALMDKNQHEIGNLEEKVEDMKVYESFDKSRNINCLMDLVLENRASEITEQMDFIKIKPLGQMAIGKPIFLDIAWNFINYPSEYKIVSETKQESKKGFLSSIFGKK